VAYFFGHPVQIAKRKNSMSASVTDTVVRADWPWTHRR